MQLVSVLYPKHTFTFSIAEVTQNGMVWKGGIGLLFNGTRTFSVLPLEDGTSDFTMEEIFKGLLLQIGRAHV